MITRQQREFFQGTVWDFYRRHGRHELPWRQAEADGSFDPYKIMVSELMLQQTQVPRVLPKFASFLALFPTIDALATAPLADVLRAWSGLGYNRRAKFLWQAAKVIVSDYSGHIPNDEVRLQTLPGIGKNTAGAIAAYAFNRPAIFVETNVRTVFIHHFFADETAVPDAAIVELVRQTLDREQAREWYWALMDYGSHLKQTVGNLARSSKSYARQSKFEGSLRQVRGAVIRFVAAAPRTARELAGEVGDDRLEVVLRDLEREQLIQKANGRFRLPGA